MAFCPQRREMFPWPGKRRHLFVPPPNGALPLTDAFPALTRWATFCRAFRRWILGRARPWQLAVAFLERRTERISADLWVEAPAFTAGVRDLPFSFCALALVVVGQNFAALGGRKSVIVRVRRQAGANGIIKM